MSKKDDISIALNYDGNTAPKVTAKGRGEIARKIIEIAQLHGIPVQQDEQLTSMLANVELNEEIPPALYVAVAQLLAFLYHINGKRPEDYHPNPSDKPEHADHTNNPEYDTNNNFDGEF